MKFRFRPPPCRAVWRAVVGLREAYSAPDLSGTGRLGFRLGRCRGALLPFGGAFRTGWRVCSAAGGGAASASGFDRRRPIRSAALSIDSMAAQMISTERLRREGTVGGGRNAGGGMVEIRRPREPPGRSRRGWLPPAPRAGLPHKSRGPHSLRPNFSAPSGAAPNREIEGCLVGMAALGAPEGGATSGSWKSGMAAPSLVASDLSWLPQRATLLSPFCGAAPLSMRVSVSGRCPIDV